MPIYLINKSQKYLVSTNLKVMSRSLLAAKELEQIDRKALIRNRLRQMFFLPGAMPHYMVVRDPFGRIESFHRDKLRKNTKNVIRDGKIQPCQAKVADALGIKGSDEEVGDALSEVSFADFVSVLPQVYDKDPHLVPQHSILRFRRYRISWGLSVTKFFKLETEDILGELKLAKLEQKNETKSTPIKIDWDEKSRQTVRDLYKEDFERFNYDPLVR